MTLDPHEHELLHAIQTAVDDLQNDVDRKLNSLIERLDAMAKTLDEILAQQTATMAKVQANTDATEAVSQRIDGLKQTILDLRDQLAAAGTDAAKLQFVSDNMAAIADSIDADTEAEKVLANTDQPSTMP